MNFEPSNNTPLPDMDTISREVGSAIPEGCADCGVQCDLASQLISALATKHVITHGAEGLVGESGQSFDTLIEQNLPEEDARKIKQLTRSSMATALDNVDEDVGDIRKKMQDNAETCNGPLKMRATRDGTTYTVNVCTSALQYGNDGEGHMPTHIKRT